MKLEPLFARILVEVAEEQEEEKKTMSGIVLPESAAPGKKQVHGIVAAVGSACKVLKVGDEVLFRQPYSNEGMVEEDGKQYLLVDEENVWARINS